MDRMSNSFCRPKADHDDVVPLPAADRGGEAAAERAEEQGSEEPVH